MTSEQDDAVFDHSLDDDDDDDSQSQDDDDLENDDVLVNDDVLNEDDDEEDLNSPSTSSPITTPTTSVIPAATIALPIATPSASAVTVAAVPNGNEPGPDPKRPRIGETLIVQQEEKKPATFDESRRLFQRLWTDEDEIELLQGFLDYTTQRGSAHHHDTALFYDQIKSKLQLDFNKNQLVEKLRRLKKKYRNVINKISSSKEFNFKSAHDQATFEISRKIWSNTGGRGSVDDTVLDDEETNLNPNFSSIVEVKSEDFVTEKKTPRPRKRSRSKSGGVKIEDNKRGLNDGFVAINNENSGGGGSVGGNGVGVIEETVRSCLSPLFKELLSGVMMGGGVCGARGIGGLAMNAMPLSFGMPAMSFGSGEVVDERWRKQQMLELEVYSKRLELVQDQIKVALEELRSMGG